MTSGGKRAKAGRKSGDGAQKTERYNVSLDAPTVAKARKIGNGNLSEGLRRSVRDA